MRFVDSKCRDTSTIVVVLANSLIAMRVESGHDERRASDGTVSVVATY